MKILRRLGLLVFAIAIFVIIFVASAKWAVFSDYDYYEKQYEKYQVSDDMDMDMEHIMDVTYEMMDFLDGKRDDLNVTTIVDGEEREFFSNDEQIHMQDVKDIFDKFILASRISLFYIIAFVLLFGVLVYLKKEECKRLIKDIAKNIVIVFGIILALAIIVTVYALIDFTSAFTIMHQLLFTNDLWLMDPRTSLLINMLPEGFFADMAVRIVTYVGTTYAIVLFMGIGTLIIDKCQSIKSKNNVKCA